MKSSAYLKALDSDDVERAQFDDLLDLMLDLDNAEASPSDLCINHILSVASQYQGKLKQL